MKKFKFLPPYKSNDVIAGVTNFPQAKQKSGVYLIKENNIIVYVGYSGTDLYKTMYRHFQVWNDKRAERVTYFSKMKRNSYTVRIVYCTPLQAARLEKMLIVKYEPRDNKDLFTGADLRQSDYNTLDTYMDIPVEREAPF